MDDTSRRTSQGGAEGSAAGGGGATAPDLGRFTFERELGRGGMGVVYLCRDPDLHRQVAVKVLSLPESGSSISRSPVWVGSPASGGSPGAGGPGGLGGPGSGVEQTRLARFEREARLLAALNHPNIATIYSIEETPSGARLLVLEYVEGETLSTRIKRTKMSIAEALDAGIQIARAIAAAHSKGIVHRDIKPSNVMLTDVGVKVLDFGLSTRLLPADGPTPVAPIDLPTGSIATEVGRVIGTIGFMSPEQARGKTVDERADIWSFGCLMYYMLTGRGPFLGASPADLLAATLQKHPDWRRLPPGTPEPVLELLMQCLEKDQEERLGDIDIAVDVLDTALQDFKRFLSGAQSRPTQREKGATPDLPSSEKRTKKDKPRGTKDEARRNRSSQIGSSGGAVVLFTAFEPSGDAHAADVIRELRRRSPNLCIFAWGGPHMEAAGATIIEQTVSDASMGLSAFTKIGRFRRYIGSIRRWAKQYRVVAHVAVDSPAANFPVCRIMRKRGARVVHLVAPQMWAWGSWRVGKLRRLTDMVLCLLPFEETWFNERNIPARFIGHPALNRKVDEDRIRDLARGLPSGAPRLAIFPGSRPHEVHANLRLLVNAFIDLQGRHQGLTGVIVAASDDVAQIIKRKIKVFPFGLHLTRTRAEAVVKWCDVALCVSGTISLDLTRQHKPMVAVYKTGILSWLGSKILLRSRFRLLPNIVAGREICPEFIPHIGGAGPIVRACSRLMLDSKNAAIQSEGLRRVAMRFSNKRPADEAAKLILQVMKQGVSR